MPDKRKTFFDKCVKDKDGRWAMWQWPNLPLWVWIAARLLAMPLHGHAHHTLQLVGDGALLLWAVLELFQGVNYFRRVLGLLVLAGTIMSLMH